MPKLKLLNGRKALSIHEVAAAMVMVTTCYLRKKKNPHCLPPPHIRKNPFSSPRHALKLKSGTKYFWKQEN
jgi:hypothetical protein